MTVIEAVRDWLKECPLLDGGKLNVDFLPAEEATYSVDVTPVPPVVKNYIDGTSLRQFAFTFSTRTYYGSLIRQQLDNLSFFEDFAEWLEEKNRKRDFPQLGEDRTGQKIEVTTSGYVFAQGTSTARYQIQCRLIYIQERKFRT